MRGLLLPLQSSSLLKPVLILACFAFCLSAQAGLREGMDAYKSGNYPDALKEFKALAEEGNPLGQYGLGMMYATGKGVAKNYTQAVTLFRQAAEQGDAGAQDFLGVMYAKGQGVPQDYQQALIWLNKAAEQHEAGAMNTLGLMYSVGSGVAADMVQAHKWFSLAESTGNRLAKKNRAMAEQKMSREQIEQSQALVSAWKAAHP